MSQFTYQEFPEKRRFGVEIEVSNNISKKDLGNVIEEYETIYLSPLKKRKRAVKVTTGVEGWAQTKKNTYWHVKFDRTCGPRGKNFDHGWEIASYIGSGTKDVNHISRLSRFLKNIGVETNLNCGLHIHVEVKDFTQTQMGVLLGRWLKIESILMSICHPSRRQNEYCMPIRQNFENRKFLFDISERNFKMPPLLLWEMLRPSDLGIHNNQSKRVTLNTIGFASAQISYNSRNTVELRLPESILDEVHVKNWIRLIVNFVETSRNKELPSSLNSIQTISDALVYLGLAGENNFLFLNNELLATKLWFLEKVVQTTQNQELHQQAKKQIEFLTL